MQLVVSDTSPLTALLQIGRADLLPALFDVVVVPTAVRQELMRKHPHLPSWLQTRAPAAIPASLASADLDAGEIEAIALALEIRADLLLIDEIDGRAAARAHGVKSAGLLGILLRAKEAGILPAVLPVVVLLRDGAGCWFSEDLIERVRLLAGE